MDENMADDIIEEGGRSLGHFPQWKKKGGGTLKGSSGLDESSEARGLIRTSSAEDTVPIHNHTRDIVFNVYCSLILSAIPITYTL